jgi:hypothetical protein
MNDLDRLREEYQHALPPLPLHPVPLEGGRAMRLRREVKPHQHGTSTGYNYGCRCDACRAARRLQARDYRSTHAEQERLRAREWARVDRERNPARCLAAVIKHQQNHPEQAVARHAVNNAVRDGRLERLPCEICGASAHAHHDDYAKPLDVRWLCPVHHKEAHR